MSNVVRRCLGLVSLLLFSVALPVWADNVTVSGNVTFASLDGSSLDHDGVANGTFTVNDGDLTVLGSINCNDDTTSNACNMNFAVSGNLTVAAGGALYAENRKGNGTGGNITATVGGNLVVGGTISSGNLSVDRAGDIAITAGGTVLLQSGSVVSGSSKGSPAGDISIQSGGAMDVRGLVAAGPSSTVVSTKYTGAVLNGGSSNSAGGAITLRSTSHSEPALSVSSDAVIVSQGENAGADTVLLEGCGIVVNGLVGSVSTAGLGAKVTVRSGTTVSIDGRDLGGAGTRLGMLRADSINQGAGTYSSNIFARNSITVQGPASGSLYVVNSSGGKTSKDPSGTINVIATAGGVTASGNAFAATGSDNGDKGGTINVSARDNVTLNTANVNASGDFVSTDASRAGGHINVRSYSGAVTWQNGTGDVRPVGSASGVPAAQQGTIALTYCTTVSTSGTSFPANGSPVGTFPTVTQTCSPAAPSLPSGESLPDCNDPPVAVNDAYGPVAEGGTLNVAAPGVLSNDSDPDGDPITAILVSGPAHASSFTFNADGSFTYVHDGGETTSDSFTYKANDGSLDSNVATVTITITPVNDAPVANNDAYTVAEGGTLNVAAPGVKANDVDPDGPGSTAILVSGPAHASSFVLNANGSFTYVHDGSETPLSDSFTYKVNDGLVDSNVATVTITITPVNDAPVAVNDAYSVAEGGTLNGSSVLGNDTDADSPSLTAVLVSGPAHASSFVLNANGTFTYVHDGSETTSDSFTYKANDGSLDSNVATVTITISPVNDAPVAVADGPYSVAEGGTLNVAAPGVLANDTDADNVTLNAVLVSGPAHASSFALNANGSFTYVHDGSETTSDSFTYKANDGSLDSNVVTVSITITAVNDAPVANDDSRTVAEGGTLNATSVLANDTDAENDSLTAVLVSGPAHASSFTFNADGTFTYVHDGSETTSDSFTYRANDGSLNSNVATVTITITPVNDAPVAVNDAYNVNEGATLTVGTPGVLGNDTDADGPSMSAVLVSGPAHASSFTLNANGSFTYVHDGSETTTDSFTYKVNDGTADSNVATVTITIAPVNDAPVAVNDAHSVNEGGTLTVSAPGVLGNDTDAENNALTAVLVSGPAHASSFALNADGSFTYVHDGGESTTDTFTYRANDGLLNSNVATVTITINPVNDAPVANNDAYSMGFHQTINIPAPGVLGNDTDVDSPTLTAVLVTNVTQGNLTLNPDGSFTYQHTGPTLGTDSFTYQAYDGTALSNTATVTITIANTTPVANGDSFSTVGNTELRVGTGPNVSPAVVVSGSVLANDTDADGGPSPLAVSAYDATSFNGGSVTMLPNGSFNYLPPTGFTGSDSFNYTVTDGSATATATVTITISQRVWYVKTGAVGPQSGRSTDPFATLGQAQIASAVNDYIYVSAGTYGSGITLKNGQRLVGSGVALVVSPFTLAPAGVAPVLTGTITLASNNLVTGVNQTLSSSTQGIAGTSVTGGTISVVNVTGGFEAITLTNCSGTFNLTDVSLAPNGDGLSIVGGTAAVNANNLDVVVTTGTGISGNAGSLTVAAGSSTVAATGGVAVDLAGMSLNVSLLSVSANGGANAIKLNNTTGTFAVTGSGTAGTGGTIQNVTARGVLLTNAAGVSLAYMNFTNVGTANGDTAAVCGNTLAGTNLNCNAAIHAVNVNGLALSNVNVSGGAQVGINGNAVSNVSMTGVQVSGVGNETFESGVQFVNLTGTNSLTNSTFQNSFYRQFVVQNSSGSMTLGVTGSAFNSTGAATGAQGALVSGNGTANMTVTVGTSTFTNNFSTGWFTDGADAAVLNVKVQNSTFTNNGGGGVSLATNNGAALTYEISGNTATGSVSSAIVVFKGTNSTGDVVGKVLNNTVGAAGVPGSACSASACDAIAMNANGSGNYTSLISGNIVRNFNGRAIASSINQSANGNLAMTLNSVSEPGGGASTGLFAQAGTLTTDTSSVCADIKNNTITGSYAAGGIRVRNRFPATTFRLPGYAGAGNDITAVQNFLSAQNGGVTVTATINGNIFGGGASCVAP